MCKSAGRVLAILRRVRRRRRLRECRPGKQSRPLAAFLHAAFGFLLHFSKRLLGVIVVVPFQKLPPPKNSAVTQGRQHAQQAEDVYSIVRLFRVFQVRPQRPN